MASRLPVLFLDDGGVMNDNALRAPQWRRLLGEFMPTRLGGTPEQWAEANRVQFPKVWDHLSARMGDFQTHDEYQREYDIRWLEAMCGHVGIPTPPDEQARQLTREATDYITRRARSEYPDAAASVRRLREAGFQLFTASGTRSWELENYLSGMGVRDCFKTLYGPDLVDTTKGGAAYYRRVFEAAGVDPAAALVLDDSPLSCAWAEAAGARTLRIDRASSTPAPGAAPDLATAAGWLIEGTA